VHARNDVELLTARPPRDTHPRVRLLPLLWLLASATSGCVVHTYQAISGLPGPVIVDPLASNFEDVHLTVNCASGEYLSRFEASKLCDRVGTLFENQGAIVTTVGPQGPFELGGDTPLDEADGPQIVRTDMTLDISAQQIHKANYPLSWALCIASFTLLPGVSETTFAQDVTIRDGEGFLLSRERMKGRMVRRFGGGPWAGNVLLDWVFRDKEDRLTGRAFEEDLSSDLYSQLSQMLFNAKMQREVLLPVAEVGIEAAIEQVIDTEAPPPKPPTQAAPAPSSSPWAAESDAGTP